MATQRKRRKEVSGRCNFSRSESSALENNDMDLLARTSSLLPKTGINKNVFKDLSIQQATSSFSSSRTRKRGRGVSREEILRSLAKDALEAMRGHGLAPPHDSERLTPGHKNAQFASKKQRRAPTTLTDCDKENVVVRPESPDSFYRKIGLHEELSQCHNMSNRSALRSTSAASRREPTKQIPSFVTPDRALRRKPDSEHPGSITPARVQAAKNLLSLMQ